MTTLPQGVINQLRQIQLKLNERTIGSQSINHKVNEPVWDDPQVKDSK